MVGTSNKSFCDAVANAVAKAGQIESNLRWFEVKSLRGNVADDGAIQYQVVLKVGFTLE